MPEIRTEIIIDAPKEAIWSVLTDFQNYERWNPFVVTIKGDLEQGKTVKFKACLHGRIFGFASKFRAVDPNRRLCWGSTKKRLNLTVMSTEHYFLIEETVQGKCRFVHGEKFKGILPVVLWLLIRTFKYQYAAMNEALKTRVEKRAATGRKMDSVPMAAQS